MLLAKAVRTAINQAKPGIAICLLGPSGIVRLDDVVFCAVDNKDGAAIGLDLLRKQALILPFYGEASYTEKPPPPVPASRSVLPEWQRNRQ